MKQLTEPVPCVNLQHKDSPQGDCQADDGTAERSSCEADIPPTTFVKTEKGRGVTPSTEGPPTGITGTHTDATADDNNNVNVSNINHHDEDTNRAAATGDGCSGPSDDGGDGQAATTGDGRSGLNDDDDINANTGAAPGATGDINALLPRYGPQRFECDSDSDGGRWRDPDRHPDSGY